MTPPSWSPLVARINPLKTTPGQDLRRTYHHLRIHKWCGKGYAIYIFNTLEGIFSLNQNCLVSKQPNGHGTRILSRSRFEPFHNRKNHNQRVTPIVTPRMETIVITLIPASDRRDRRCERATAGKSHLVAFGLQSGKENHSRMDWALALPSDQSRFFCSRRHSITEGFDIV